MDVENARRDPDLFLDNHREPLILDEVQYSPEVVAAIKRRIDRDRRPGRFILTGSQQWGVLRSISESLAGRAVFVDLAGFELAEVCRAQAFVQPWLEAWLSDPAGLPSRKVGVLDMPYSLYEYLFRGQLPEATGLPLEMIRVFHQGYRRTYIERDVRMVGDIGDYQLFGRFFQLAAVLTAQEINYSHLGRELGITPKTAHAWLDVLRGTCQWFEVSPYSGIVSLTASPHPSSTSPPVPSSVPACRRDGTRFVLRSL